MMTILVVITSQENMLAVVDSGHDGAGQRAGLMVVSMIWLVLLP